MQACSANDQINVYHADLIRKLYLTLLICTWISNDCKLSSGRKYRTGPHITNISSAWCVCPLNCTIDASFFSFLFIQVTSRGEGIWTLVVLVEDTTQCFWVPWILLNRFLTSIITVSHNEKKPRSQNDAKRTKKTNMRWDQCCWTIHA